jgi:protein tyrosine/serine phosphatase
MPARMLHGMRGDMGSPAQRWLGYLEHVLFDHGFMRWLWLNRHTIATGVERSAQPSPGHLRDAAGRGVKSIVNLRGDKGASWLMETDACERYGLKLVDLPLRSRGAPTTEEIFALEDMFRQVERPFLMHCKSGADRAGLASAIYLLLIENRPVEEAMQQLSLRFGHIKRANTGILDAFLETYRAENAREPISFRDWVNTRYDRDALQRNFRSGAIANFVTDRILRRE